jgi:DNA-binding response OmpR family regulator
VKRKQRKILCVEDHPDTCELIAAILDEYELISAGTIQEAEQRFLNDAFEMVLLDYHLPDGTGIELCQRLREHDEKVPILFVTGSSGVTKATVSKVGGQDVLRKGTVDFVDRLLSHVRSMCKPAEA